MEDGWRIYADYTADCETEAGDRVHQLDLITPTVKSYSRVYVSVLTGYFSVLRS